MKKLFLMLAVAAFSAQTISAQTVEESLNCDNWYIGINGGANVPASTFKFDDINYQAGLRIGRWFTPVVGLAVEGQAFFGKNAGFDDLKTTVKQTNVSLLGTLNFNNWFAGYNGTPRCFEIIGIAGLGWQHTFDEVDNAMSSKVGLDFAYNFGSDKQWQLYLEPALVYTIADAHMDHVAYNINDAIFQANLGLVYKFGNSNGTHNFKVAELRDQAEIDGLNAKINELGANINDKDAQLSAKDGQIRQLKADLDECRNRPTENVTVVNKPTTVTNLQPMVIFGKGKSSIDQAGYASIELIATYMKKHPEAKIEIKGYASPEGNPEVNQRLSQARADAVKNVLVKKHKIAASRLTATGMGATDELFDEVEFNRVATFNDTAK